MGVLRWLGVQVVVFVVLLGIIQLLMEAGVPPGVVGVLAVVQAPFTFSLLLAIAVRRQLRHRVASPPAPIEVGALTAALLSRSAELEGLGFRRNGSPLELQAGGWLTRWQPFISPDRKCVASLSERQSGRSPFQQFSQVDSFLSDGRWLMSGSDPGTLLVPSHPGVVVQGLVGASLSAVVEHHQDALRALATSGVTAQPVADDFSPASMEIPQALYSRASLKTVYSMWWRHLTKRSPHAGPLAARLDVGARPPTR